ncbi:hypothetical protein L1987_71170 [Smallanthus sonchifolius]|uniref:Uncharacterized protein n=1 Tax=Smallanthus sonchifolius TaxID=185202 RepID=A0ACB9ARQ0_9ASTR|nr:hypothetical protein L1987_71170 [Smallanthus sonchifolius]
METLIASSSSTATIQYRPRIRLVRSSNSSSSTSPTTLAFYRKPLFGNQRKLSHSFHNSSSSALSSVKLNIKCGVTEINEIQLVVPAIEPLSKKAEIEDLNFMDSLLFIRIAISKDAIEFMLDMARTCFKNSILYSRSSRFLDLQFQSYLVLIP